MNHVHLMIVMLFDKCSIHSLARELARHLAQNRMKCPSMGLSLVHEIESLGTELQMLVRTKP